MTHVNQSQFAYLDQFGIEPRSVMVRAYLSGSESPSDEGSELEDARLEQTKRTDAEVPQEYHTIMKATKYMKTGDQSACIISLCTLEEFDLDNPYNLHALADDGGLELLVNMLEVNDFRCRLGGLKVCKKISNNLVAVNRLVNLGIVPVLVDRMYENSPDMQALAATILCNVAYKRRASKAARRCGAIQLLVSEMNVKKETLILPDVVLTTEERSSVDVARAAAHALWTLSKFSKNKAIMMSTGIIPFVSRIMLSGNKSVSFPTMGILCECSSLFRFQLAIETEGLVGVLLTDIASNDVEMQRLCATALMRAAGGNGIVRDMMRFHGGMSILIKLLHNVDDRNTPLMSAVIGTVWKSAITEENVLEYEKMGAVEMLVEFLDSPDMEVRIMAVGALAEMAKLPSCRGTIVSLKAVPKFIYMLGRPNPELLANVAQVVGEIAKNKEGMEQLEKGDGVRLIWSLLKNSDRRVRIKGLWAIKPCVIFAEDSGEMIRSLTGSLELLVNMLKEEDTEVLTGVCTVIAEVALDYENLAVMTEQSVVRRLARLVGQKDTSLRRELSAAIANCCALQENAVAFGQMHIIPVLSTYLNTKNQEMLGHACRAVLAMSMDMLNCISLHGCGIVPLLLKAVESYDEETQNNAADCLANMRRMLYRADLRKDNYDTRKVNWKKNLTLRHSTRLSDLSAYSRHK